MGACPLSGLLGAKPKEEREHNFNRRENTMLTMIDNITIILCVIGVRILVEHLFL